MYSPIIPKASNCDPEKIDIIEAKKVNPGILLPTMNQLKNTYKKTVKPKEAMPKPM